MRGNGAVVSSAGKVGDQQATKAKRKRKETSSVIELGIDAHTGLVLGWKRKVGLAHCADGRNNSRRAALHDKGVLCLPLFGSGG